MTREEAKHKLDFMKKAYQKLIDEKVDSGKLVGDGVRGEWKAEAPLDEAYKDMIEALDLAIKALGQQPCEDCVSRKLLSDNICEGISCNECSFNEIDGESGCLLQKRFDELPSVTPKAEQKWIPCEERLPEEGGDYLVTTKWEGSYSGDTYIETNMAVYREKLEEWDCKDVIAWMPLPEPYKAESEDNE